MHELLNLLLSGFKQTICGFRKSMLQPRWCGACVHVNASSAVVGYVRAVPRLGLAASGLPIRELA